MGMGIVIIIIIITSITTITIWTDHLRIWDWMNRTINNSHSKRMVGRIDSIERYQSIRSTTNMVKTDGILKILTTVIDRHNNNNCRG